LACDLYVQRATEVGRYRRTVVDTPPSSRRALQALAVIAAALVALVYVLAVRTRWGQRLDATALQGRRALEPRAVHAAARLLTTIDVASLVLIGGAIVVVALVRARPRLALGAGAIIAGSILTSEMLKHVVLTRPELGITDALRTHPSYPSGHTTVAMSLGIAAMLVAPKRWRTAVGVIGVAYASAIGVAVVATANHRPSDPIGAAFVVTAWSASIASVFVISDRRRQPDPSATRAPPWIVLGGLVLIVIAFVGLAATIVAIRRNRLDTIELGGAFLAASTAIVGTVVLTTGAIIAALRDTELERQRDIHPAYRTSDRDAPPRPLST
jgi:membrane-associated phospholipid phosphatase